MRKLSYLILVLATSAFIFIGCEGPAGPKGADGAAGAAGAAGTVGVAGAAGAKGDAGESGTTTCVTCHNNSQKITIASSQYAASTHATGGHASYGSRINCAPCHTSQGFLEVNKAGGFGTVGNTDVAAAITNPAQPNCYTCHSIHDTYTEADWGLTKTTATVAWQAIDGTTAVSADLGKGNACSACHQGRAATVYTNWNDGGTAKLTPTSYRQGLHHGPQYNILIGEGLYKFAGATGYPTTQHMVANTTDGCVDCHMASGHGMSPSEPASCGIASCHTSGDIGTVNTKFAPVETAVKALIVQLKDSLVANKVIQSTPAGAESITTYLWRGGATGSSGDLIEQTEEHLAAALNLQAIAEDRSLGMHNPKYVKAILKNTLEKVFGVTP